jgi:hypothetical protein
MKVEREISMSSSASENANSRLEKQSHNLETTGHVVKLVVNPRLPYAKNV